MNGREKIKSKSYGKLDIAIPEQLFQAGTKSIASIVIKNPFDNPIVLIDVVAPQSTKLTGSSEPRKKYEGSDEFHTTSSTKKKSSTFRRVLKSISKLLNTAISLRSLDIGFGIASVSFEVPQDRKVININAEKQAEIELTDALNTYDELNINADESSKITIVVPEPQAIETEDSENLNILQPHSEVVRYLSVQSKGWLLFKPTKLPVHVEVSYRFVDDPKEMKRSQVVTTTFEIRPPLLANIFGSIIGSILGTIAKELQGNTNLNTEQLLLTITTSLVMSSIATVALSRKTDSQGFITVEDFYGGFVLGAIIGYTGSKYFEKAILSSSSDE